MEVELVVAMRVVVELGAGNTAVVTLVVEEMVAGEWVVAELVEAALVEEDLEVG